MKTNLIFDSNFLAYRNLFLLYSQSNNNSVKFLNLQEDQTLFIRKMMMDLDSIIRILPPNSINKAIWCMDSRSWRKGIYESINYKGDRKKDGSINWDVFHDLCDDFSKVLKECGFVVSKVDLAEADDLIYLYTKKIIEMDESCIVITSDKDLRQIVRADSKNRVVCLFNPLSSANIFTFHENLENVIKKHDDIDPLDELLNPSSDSPAEVIFKVSANHERNFVSPEWELFLKVLLGDKSDNIPSIIQWKRPSGDTEKKFSLTERMISKTNTSKENFYNVDTLLSNKTLLEMFCESLLHECPSTCTVDLQTAIKRFAENVHIVKLHESNIPEIIKIEDISDHRSIIDITEHKVYSLRPEWKYEPKQKKVVHSDVFSFLS